jgi:8-amino-7-oxononanoate synthase
MQGLDQALKSALSGLADEGLYRTRRVVESIGPGHRVRVDGSDCTAFCSNDYLGLATDERIADAMGACAAIWGAGAGAAHLVTGHSALHHALEEALADFTGRERALLFSTGYMANLGVVSALAGRDDFIAEDRLNHASLIDAARLSGATVRRFRHGDADAADRRLAAAEGRRRLVLTDGVFSMDGDRAPLAKLAAIASNRDAILVVDDAHGIGVLGEHGAGTAAAAGLGPSDVPVLIGTLGKAFGTFGAFVAGSEALIETLIHKARTYVYTTAPPPPVAAATLASLAILREETWRRDRLVELVARFRHGAAAAGLVLGASDTPIQPVLIGDSAAALQASEALLERGWWVSAIRPPTVPRGSARLRVTLSATHEDEQVDGLVAALAEVLDTGARVALA